MTPLSIAAQLCSRGEVEDLGMVDLCVVVRTSDNKYHLCPAWRRKDFYLKPLEIAPITHKVRQWQSPVYGYFTKPKPGESFFNRIVRYNQSQENFSIVSMIVFNEGGYDVILIEQEMKPRSRLLHMDELSRTMRAVANIGLPNTVMRCSLIDHQQ